MTFQHALRHPLGVYQSVASEDDALLSVRLIKMLIDFKTGRLRQCWKRYLTCLTDLGLDPDRPLIEQSEQLTEDTAQLCVFELLFQMASMVPDQEVDIDSYIEVLDYFGPDDRVLHGALYNCLVPVALRNGEHAASRQFALLALEEYGAAGAPYLEAYVHMHLSLLEIAQANYPEALAALDRAERHFRKVQNVESEVAQVGILRAWVMLEHANVVPDDAWFEATKKELQSDGFWMEPFLMFATVQFRTNLILGRDDILEAHAELETLIRVRRMTPILPAMQLMRDEYFSRSTGLPDVIKPTNLAPFQLLLLQPTPETLALNYGDAAQTAPVGLARLQAVQYLLRGHFALKARKFSAAADAIWPGLERVETYGFKSTLSACLPIIETFIAECRARRRFVEKARYVRDVLLPPVTRPKVTVDAPVELTLSEYAVLTLLPDATSNKAMARDLDVSEPTIKFHLKNIYRKLAVNRRRDAIKAAAARGWIHLPETPPETRDMHTGL